MEQEHRLSDEQAAVVGFDRDAGHLLVLARPGSGKTHTLAARAGRLLADGVDPRQLLAMTSSNRAAEQLKDRLPGGHIWAGTFHAISADILERYGSAIGVRWPFRIADDIRSREFILRAIADVGYPLASDDRARLQFLREVQSRIERRKREGRERAESRRGDYLDADVVATIDETYCRLLEEANALDFADLIGKAIATLEQDALAGEALRNRLTHVLVDEVRDISPEQYQLMSLLAPARSDCEVFVVGDPDQSIYEWRGAHADRMIAQYRREYRPVEFGLSVNFRSRAPIVVAADTLMAMRRASQPHRGGTIPPYWCEFPDAQAEAREVAATIARARASGQRPGFGAFAVLYRTHAVGDKIEAELLQAEIPVYRIQQDRFFHQRDAQESLRYLELAFGMHEDGFEPALNWPRVIVDELTMVHLRQLAARQAIRLTDIVHRIDEFNRELSPLTRAAIREFRDTIVSDLGPIMGLPIDEALDSFLDILKRRRSPIARVHREALRDSLDLLEQTLEERARALECAIRAGRPLALRLDGGPDCAAAEAIVRHAIESYLGLPIETVPLDETLADAFTVTLGEDLACDPRGFGLGPLHTRTVQLSVAARAWRLMQMVLMSYETLDRGAVLLLDVETTTRHPERAEIVEFGALPFSGGEACGEGIFSLVRPSSPTAIDPEATDTHGLRWRAVAGAPTPREALPVLITLAETCVVVGHNVEVFDLPVLRQSAARAGLAFRPPLTIDTRRMAQRLWPEEASYRLEDLARRSSPGLMQEHRARCDCLLTARLFSDLLAQARRDRELDVMTECLPLVAAGVAAGGNVVAHDNELFATIGARVLALGHGRRLLSDWEADADAASVAAARSLLAASQGMESEEDDRWARFRQGWVSAVAGFCASTEDWGIGGFLRYAALAQPIDALPHTTTANGAADPRVLTADERVTLMTVHSAKGLEWPVVFIAGVEDDQFPLYRATDAAQLAEERRTLYVGMTRAKDRLFLFSSHVREGRARSRSRFLGPLIGSVVEQVVASQRET